MSQVIINDIPPYTQALASGGQTVFGTNWTANVASDVVVYLTPVNTSPDDFTNILNYPSDYSVAFIGASQEVQVTLTNPATLGDKITIVRDTPADRENLYSNTNFLPSMLNNDFGILTLVDQQAQLVNQKIAPRYNYSATITDVVDTILPVLGANQVWIKNANNDEIIPLTITNGQVGSGTVNLGQEGQLAYYPSNGNQVNGLTTEPSNVLVTNFLGAPEWSNELPSGITAPDMTLTTPGITGGTLNTVTIDNSTLNSPILVTPVLGTPASGTLTNCIGLPSGSGILCSSTNDNASAGQLGEFKSSVISSGSPVTLVSGSPNNITSLSLTAGDWDVWGNVTFVTLGTVTHAVFGWLSSVSMTTPDASLYSGLNANTNTIFSFLAGSGFSVPFQRFSLSTTTPIYLSAVVSSNSNCTACGAIYARRAR